MSTTSRGPSRRTLVKGAAWSVPVVAVAGAAPAMAASPVIVPEFDGDGFCKHVAGGSTTDYHTVLCLDNTSDEDITVVFTSMTIGGTRTRTTVTPGSVTVPAGQRVCSYVDGTGFETGAEDSIRLDFTYESNGETIHDYIATGQVNHLATPCGTSPREDQPGGRPPHPPYPSTDGITPSAVTDESSLTTGTVEESVVETESPAPAPAPGDDASATSAP